ncbi:hypothetical protein CZ774_14135 [Frigoribacterium sp. JB110]|nr:hypothetical protein CZ774_14135 [Frigoribacterium sp. JB110]
MATAGYGRNVLPSRHKRSATAWNERALDPDGRMSRGRIQLSGPTTSR